MSRTKELYRDQVDQDYQKQYEQQRKEKEDFLYQTEVLDKQIVDDKDIEKLPLSKRMIIAEHRFKLLSPVNKPVEK
jgi:hypothetical protein